MGPDTGNETLATQTLEKELEEILTGCGRKTKLADKDKSLEFVRKYEQKRHLNIVSVPDNNTVPNSCDVKIWQKIMDATAKKCSLFANNDRFAGLKSEKYLSKVNPVLVWVDNK